MTTRFQKNDSETKTLVFDFESLLDGNTISSITSVIATPSGLSINSQNIVSETIEVSVSNGINGKEYKVAVRVLDSDSNDLSIDAKLLITENEDLDYYGSVWEGDRYFNDRLNIDTWEDSTNQNKRKALVEATRLIDRLNYKGVKVGELQFPRGTDTEEPSNIKYATFELALSLLDDNDPDVEVQLLNSMSQSYDKVRETYDRTAIPDYIQAGIISYRAWEYLKPYLRDPLTVNLSRVS